MKKQSIRAADDETKIVLDTSKRLWYTVTLMTIPTDEGFIDQNIEIDHLPRSVDNILKTLAHLRGMTKKSIVREALVEYVERHRGEIPKLAGGGKTK